MLHGAPYFPIYLKFTNTYLLDSIVRVLFMSSGVAIVLGIRSHLFAAFLLSMTLLEASICIQSNFRMALGQTMLPILILGPAILTIRGGGILAMR
jgi:hypothetical protein